jgi:hypothetical protein
VDGSECPPPAQTRRRVVIRRVSDVVVVAIDCRWRTATLSRRSRHLSGCTDPTPAVRSRQNGGVCDAGTPPSACREPCPSLFRTPCPTSWRKLSCARGKLWKDRSRRADCGHLPDWRAAAKVSFSRCRLNRSLRNLPEIGELVCIRYIARTLSWDAEFCFGFSAYPFRSSSSSYCSGIDGGP